MTERDRKTRRMETAAKELIRACWARDKETTLPDGTFPPDEMEDRTSFLRRTLALHHAMTLCMTSAVLLEIPGFDVDESVMAEAFRLTLQSNFEAMDEAAAIGAISVEAVVNVKAMTAMHLIGWLGSAAALNIPEVATKQ